MPYEKVRVDELRLDGGTQPRVEINQALVEEYARDMAGGSIFPPVIVFYDGENYWLADGFHRVMAAALIEREDLYADLREGTLRDAILYSCGANATHGLRRSNADKRAAVEKLLLDEEWVRWSDNEIARRCAVSNRTVSNIRAELELTMKISKSETRTYTTRHGTEAQMDTSNIGQREPSEETAPAPVADDDIPFPEVDEVALDEVCVNCGLIGPVNDESLCPYCAPSGEDESQDPHDTHPDDWPDEVPQKPKHPDPLMRSDSDEWYTPQHIVERVRAVFGGRNIALDPCSTEEANEVVRADDFWTKKDDGLDQPWYCSCLYMNPPYGDQITAWVEKLVAEFEVGRVRQAIALLPARTDTAWFRLLAPYPRCFLHGRLQFWGPGANGNSATFPSVVVALGCDLDVFAGAFADVGDVYVRYAYEPVFAEEEL